MNSNRSNIIILPIVLVSLIILAVLSYNYFTQTANQIQQLATSDLQTNAEIEAYSISTSLSNAISGITSNLALIANSPSTMEGNFSNIQSLLNTARDSTRNLTDGYYYLDSNGRLVTFTGIEKEENAKYKDINLSHRNYFQIPKQDEVPYISTVIDSNDNISRIYISFPVIENKQITSSDSIIFGDPDTIAESKSNSTVFKGIIVASIEAKTLGKFLEGQVHPKLNGDIAFMDRNGTIIYTQNQTFIGKNYYASEFQSYLKKILKDKETEFNNIIKKALNQTSGLDEFNFENSSTTIAYEAVTGPQTINNDKTNDRIGTLFITVPHTLAGDVASLIDKQQFTNFSILVLIVSIATVIVIIMLRWNKLLLEIVNQKTSELREAVDKLSKANDELKSHEKLQKEFINIAAHELRTPTQAISGNLELIEMTCLPSLFKQSFETSDDDFDAEFDSLIKDKDRLRQFKSGLVSTYRNSQRLEKLVNNILDVSRIESDRLQLHKEYFNLNEKIQNVLKDIHGKYNASLLSSLSGTLNNINIEFEPTEDPVTVFADKIRIFEVLTNLLTNAIKFSEDKPITISVKKIQKSMVEHTPPKDNGNRVTSDNLRANDEYKKMMAVVSIRDRGKGIDLEILPRLFTKFVTKSNQGTGLGLYLAKSIVEAHGGQIWAQNNYDGSKGATFSFSLPMDK